MSSKLCGFNSFIKFFIPALSSMSKKKTSVMEQERKNFVYGNKEEGVPGCVCNGISEQVANKIFDEMIDMIHHRAHQRRHIFHWIVIF